MLPAKLAFVDIETTGMRAFYDRVIEIGILRVEDNKITGKFHSLIDPQTHIPSEITRMTGIKAIDLEKAPTFRQLKDYILEALRDCVFVAHNVRFDYSFLKNEFNRLNISYKSKHFCTVRLSRALFPQYRHHNLDSLIDRFGFVCSNRHRAYDDAKIIYSFYEKILSSFPVEQIAKAIDLNLKKPTIPLKLKTSLDTLPEHSGVYIFYGTDGNPLYIGKSINLRKRILSHFSSDLRSPLEMKISQQIESIETIVTAGELGALLLESQLIKKHTPLYNKKSRLKQELLALQKHTTKNGYETVVIKTITNLQLGIDHKSNSLNSYLCFFRSRKQAKSFLTQISQEYNLCEKLLGIESSNWRTKNPCFAYRLGRCRGACIGNEKTLLYNLRFHTAISSTKIKPWPFPGPILITETDGTNKEQFILNKWCYLRNIKIDAIGNENENLNLTNYFDLDTYNILKHYLSQPQNHKKIKILT